MTEQPDRYPVEQLSAVVLAAGASRRFGSNKLIHSFEGRPLIEHILETFEQVDLARRIVVLGGAHHEELASFLKARPAWEICVNHRAHAGMGTSIAAGANMLDNTVGVFVCPADMPRIRPTDMLATAALYAGPTSICRPTFQDQPGHPVLFGGAHLTSLQQLEGHTGAAAILRNSSSLLTYPSNNPGVIFDVDHPGAPV